MPRAYSEFYGALRTRRSPLVQQELARYFGEVDQSRVTALAKALSTYVYTHLPRAIARRKHLGDYRTNPYVLMTSASSMQLLDAGRFAEFLVNNKLYMGLETSFGKSIESTIVSSYPFGEDVTERWTNPPEKTAESAALAGLSNEARARVRGDSVWREVDKSCVVGGHRYLLLIKSGPNCINDTQVEAMRSAIANRYRTWMTATRQTYPGITGLSIIIGLTYGTDRTTNNKENQILVKLMDSGFEEEDRVEKPGVLIDAATRSVRVQRRVGRDFWGTVGRPDSPELAQFVFLEVLLGLAKALAEGAGRREVEDGLRGKIHQLAEAIAATAFPSDALPAWLRADFTDSELVWLAAAMTAFFDEGV